MAQPIDVAQRRQTPDEPPPSVAVLDILQSIRPTRALQTTAELDLADLVVDDVDPAAGEIFDAAMASVSRRLLTPVLDACDFSRFHTLVDVGDKHGYLLGAVLAAYPALSGILSGPSSTSAELDQRLREAQADGRSQWFAAASWTLYPRAVTPTCSRACSMTGPTK